MQEGARQTQRYRIFQAEGTARRSCYEQEREVRQSIVNEERSNKQCGEGNGQRNIMWGLVDHKGD